MSKGKQWPGGTVGKGVPAFNPLNCAEVKRRNAVVHFHNSDTRFCGSTQQCRRVTFDPNQVTCRACMAKDCFALSPDAIEYLRSLPNGAA